MTWIWWTLGILIALLIAAAIFAVFYPWQTDPLGLQRRL